MAVGQEFLDMINGLNNYYGEVQNPQDPFLHWEQITENYEIYPSELENTVDLLPKGEVVFNADGTIRSYDIATEVTSDIDLASMIDSNIQPTKTKLNIPSNTTIDSQTGKVVATTGVAGGASVGNFVRGSLVPAVAAAGIGITLGKAVDEILYHANPDFWDSIGWSTLNPETWSSITQDDASLNSRVFNAIFGLDPVTNTSQAYIDQTALAYLTKILYDKGFFDTASESSSYDLPSDKITYVNMPINLTDVGNITINRNPPSPPNHVITFRSNNDVKVCQMEYAGNRLLFASATPNTVVQAYYDGASDNTYSLTSTYTYDNKTVYYNEAYALGRYDTVTPNYENTVNYNGSHGLSAWVMVYGVISGGTVIDGITTQPDATTPTINPNDDIDAILEKLQEQYPDLFNQAITQDVVQPDGSVITYTYVPIAMPDPNTTPTEGYSPTTQPVSGTATQEDPKTDPETATQTQLAYIIGLLTNTTQDLDDTGEGETPPVVIPTGTASALFSVYNPSQSEINSFGGWLWSSNFVDQLLKMFNDPMQAIISLHKVFCTPSISGRGDIKVGYLNSGVEANVVDKQYVDVDCGTIQLTEVFQNVFDYPPFTEVSLYLPFIGFVKLDVNDIMRGTMQVIYHVDVLTGACLADVKVTRDMFGGVIYQYNGDCSVHYPLSSGSYMGMVTAALGVAGTIASGGSMIPMLLGAAKAKTSVERSGNLSGNAGAMGIKKPYLVIQRPQTSTANEFNKYLGKPANFTTKIGSATGFISCTEVHIENCNGTDSELAELERLLKEGILI